MQKKANLYIPHEKIAEFCKANRIRRLALFGSVLREDFNPSSDVDVLVEFEADARVGMIRLSAMEMELGQILGRKVDLNTRGFLSSVHPEMVDFGSGQGRSDFATAGVVSLRRGLRRARTPAWAERCRLWTDTK